MDVILGDMSLYDLHIVCFAYLSQEIPRSQRNVSPKDWLAVFRDPDQVVLDIVHGMARFPIVLHTASILKSSPEGEGFNPIVVTIKKADVAEHPEVFDHVGLLTNEPLGTAGLLSI